MHEKRFNRELEQLRDPDRITLMEVNRVVDLVLEGLNDPKNILDVGTGSGLFAEQFAAKGLKVTGLDANPEMILAAQEFVPSGEFQVGVAEKMPFEDNCFDVVFMGLLLHEVDDLSAALREASRIVKQRLAVLEWVFENQSFGPPLEHRLPFDKIESAAYQAGFKSMQEIRLVNLVLYLLQK